jgi:hypothetical protein
MDLSAWAQCPECRAFFQLKDTTAREISQALPIDDASAADDDSQPAAETMWLPLETKTAETRLTFSDSSSQTIPEIESAAPVEKQDSNPFGPATRSMTGPVNEDPYQTYSSERSPSTVTDVAAHLAAMNAPHEQTLDEQAANSTAQSTLIQSEPIGPSLGDSPIPESLEDSAERIDKWFRSAKSLAEDSSSPSTNVPDLPEKPGGEEAVAAQAENTDDKVAAVPELEDAKVEIKLEDRPVLSENGATWEDSVRMERLLADIDGKPAGESAPDAEKESMASSNDPSDSVNQWSTEISPTLSMGAASKPRRKKSALRSLAMSAVAGVIGIALGYYSLFWIAGPSGDFLDVAQYLPSAILPAEFESPAAQLAVTTAPPLSNEADPGEMQASFNEPVAPAIDASAGDDKYAPASETDAPADEPPSFDSPAAAPLAEDAAAADVPNVLNAPSFTADELAVALRLAKEAQPGLVAGDLDDSKEAQRAKGFGYSLLCDLAQKVAFVDKSSRADYIAPLEDEASTLVRQTLADAHTREEVARIVPKWIASANRKHGGVFFAGTLSSGADKGSVVQCAVELEGGTALTVLVPHAQAERLADFVSPVGIVGWITDKPAEQIAGYTGDVAQAIFVSRIIPLE